MRWMTAGDGDPDVRRRARPERGTTIRAIEALGKRADERHDASDRAEERCRRSASIACANPKTVHAVDEDARVVVTGRQLTVERPRRSVPFEDFSGAGHRKDVIGRRPVDGEQCLGCRRRTELPGGAVIEVGGAEVADGPYGIRVGAPD